MFITPSCLLNSFSSWFFRVCMFALVCLVAQSVGGVSYANDSVGTVIDDPVLVDEAARLNHDVSQIFRFVRDEIRYEAYEGKLRGARGTLWEGAGNSADQAALLAALLEISGYSVSYQHGSLDQQHALKLIKQMFQPSPYRVVGFVDNQSQKTDIDVSPTSLGSKNAKSDHCPSFSKSMSQSAVGMKKYDPANDDELIKKVSAHFWIKAEKQGSTLKLDPSFADASMDQVFTKANQTFDAFPLKWVHRVRVQLVVEEMYSLVALLGYEPTAKTVLDETFDVSDLTGKALSLGHDRRSGGQSTMIGANIQHTYIPFITVVQNDDDIEDDPVIVGQSFSETPQTIAGFLGSSVLNSITLKVTTLSPSGEQTHTRLLFDNTNESQAKRDPVVPLLDRTDRFTLFVSGISNVLPVERVNTDALMQINDKTKNLTNFIANLDQNNLTDEQKQEATKLKVYSSHLSTVQNLLMASRFSNLAEKMRDSLDQLYVSKSYTSKPQIILSKTKVMNGATTKAQSVIDLVARNMEVLPYPGQSKDIAISYQMMRSFSDISAEAMVLKDFNTNQIKSTKTVGDVFDAAEKENIAIRTISPLNVLDVDQIEASEAAKAMMLESLKQLHLIIVPEQKVMLDGQPYLAWYEVNSATGEVIDFNEQGEHFSSIEWALGIPGKTFGDPGVWEVGVSPLMGFALGTGAYIETVLTCHIPGYECAPKEQKETKARAYKFAKDAAKMIREGRMIAKHAAGDDQTQKAIGGLICIPSLSKLYMELGIETARIYWNSWVKIDPPLPGSLIGLFDEVDTNSLNGFVLVDEPLFTLNSEQGEVKSLLRALIPNKSNAAQTYRIEGTAPAGFVMETSFPEVVVPAGKTGVVGAALKPLVGTQLPPPGTIIPVGVTITPEGGQPVTIDHKLPAPVVEGLSLQLDPTTLVALPNEAIEANLELKATGNVALANIQLQHSLVNGMTVNGLPKSVSLGVGEVRQIPLTVTGTEQLRGQSPLVEITAAYGSNLDGEAYKQHTEATLRVVSESTIALEKFAACSARQKHSQLAWNLKNVSSVLNQIDQEPTNEAYLNRAALLFQQLVDIAQITPNMALYLGDIQSILNHAKTQDGPKVLEESRSFFKDKAVSLCQHLSVSMSLPAGVLLQPGELKQIPIQLNNTGERDLEVNLSLLGVPADVDAKLNKQSISLGAQQNITLDSGTLFVDVFKNLASDGAYALMVKAEVVNVPGLTLTANTLVKVRSSHVDVLDIQVQPNSIEKGDEVVAVKATILNTANVSRGADAVLSISKKDGTLVHTYPAESVTLHTGMDPLTLQLPSVKLPSLSQGSYQMKLQLFDAVNKPIPGQNTETAFWVGQPISASISTDQTLLPPGSHEVTVSLDVRKNFDTNLDVISFKPTDPSLDRVNWAAQSKGSSIVGGNAFNPLIDGQPTASHFHVTENNPLVIDLGAERSFDELMFSISNRHGAHGYAIDGSNDGVSFSTIVNKKDTIAYQGKRVEFFTPVSYRYLRFSGASASAQGIYLTDEILVIGDETTQVFAEQSFTLSASSGLERNPVSFNLAAGIYEVSYVSGAFSRFATDTDNSGKSWEAPITAFIPSLNKQYRFGFIQDKLSRYASVTETEQSMAGKKFTLRLDARSDVNFYIPKGGNSERGSIGFKIRQLSGPNNSLIARVQDAMTRSVLWEQPAVAQWESANWVKREDRTCFGCHTQTQASVGLAASKRKLPSLPVDESLTIEFIDAYQTWLNTEGRTISGGRDRWPVTQTSLWAWAVSEYDATDQAPLAAQMVQSTEWLLGKQEASGGWNADHSGSDANRIYKDGVPSATLTAGNMKSLMATINLLESADRIVPFDVAVIAGNQVAMTKNMAQAYTIDFGALANATGILIEVKDTFATNTNFVLNEIQFFDDSLSIPVQSAVASREQSGYPISASHNGTVAVATDGWAVGGNTVSDAAQGLWIFDGAQKISHMHLTQIYNADHQFKQFEVRYTTDPNPSLSSTFQPVPINQVGHGMLVERKQRYQQALSQATDLLLDDQWAFSRNTRTAAQTIIGLHDAMSSMDANKQSRAQQRMQEVLAFLKENQNLDGGWGDLPGKESTPFHTAQALEAALLTSENTINSTILRGAEYLLLGQQPSGAWSSSGFRSSLATTSRVQIALPTLFENISGVSVTLAHDFPNDTSQASYVSNSAAPSTEAGLSSPTHLFWNEVLGRNEQKKTFTLRASVPDITPGEIRAISVGSLLNYQSILGEGEVKLPVVHVAGARIIDVTPNIQDMNTDTPVVYQVLLDNPSATSQTYQIDVIGLDDLEATWPAQVTIQANTRTSVPLSVTHKTGATGDRSFQVTATTATGGKDNAQAGLNIKLPASDPNSQPPDPITLSNIGVDIQLVPNQNTVGLGTSAMYTVRVINTGFQPATFNLSGAFPAGFETKWSKQSIQVSPGSAAAQEVKLMLKAPANAQVIDHHFSVMASTTENNKIVEDQDEGVLTVMPLGVALTFADAVVMPDSQTQLKVTNTGQQRDQFKLHLDGSGYLHAQLLQDVVDLEPNESTTVMVQLGQANGRLPGSYNLHAMAISQTKSSIRSAADTTLKIDAKRSVEANLEPSDVTLDQLGDTPLTLVIRNTSNQAERYTISLGDVSSTLNISSTWWKKSKAQSAIQDVFTLQAGDEIRLPYRADLLAYGESQVEFKVRSDDGRVEDSAKGLVRARAIGAPGMTVIETEGQTVVNEDKSTDEFYVVLTSQPVGEVAVQISMVSNDEITLAPQKLIFTPSNWQTSQAVQVQGLNDDVVDGDQTIEVKLSIASALQDPNYQTLAAQRVIVVNQDNDSITPPIPPTPPVSPIPPNAPQPVLVPSMSDMVKWLLALMFFMLAFRGLERQRNRLN